MKKCTRCGEFLPFDMFYKTKKNVDGWKNGKHHADKNGIFYRCKECHKKNQRVPLEIKKNRKDELDERLKVNTLSDVDSAYIAGILDGEGCISLSKSYSYDKYRNAKYCLGIKITNTFPGVIDWIALKVGHGSVHKRKGTPDGYKQSWAWSIAGRRAIDLLKQLHPYLKIKKLQAEVAFDYNKTIAYPGHLKLDSKVIVLRDELKSRLSELNNMSY